MEDFIEYALFNLDTDALLLDKFMHDGFYQDGSSFESNLDNLDLFLKNYR